MDRLNPVPGNPTSVDQGVINHAPTLGKIIRTFKASSAHQIRENNQLVFPWQRNYYEHIIRHEDELNRIRQYIRDNSLNWETDEENPNKKTEVVTGISF